MSSSLKPALAVDSEDEFEYPAHKLPQAKPKEWKPFLSSFTAMKKFPLEVRQLVWKATLKPRVVEIRFSEDRGFYTTSKAPVALGVCTESRAAVLHFYPRCFGNVIHEPMTLFNFSLDTLYFDRFMGPDVYALLFSITKEELSGIKYMAIDSMIDMFHEWDDIPTKAYNNMSLLRKAAKAMPALKEVHMITLLDEDYHEHGFPEGNGPPIFGKAFPYELQQFMYHELYHLEDEDAESECQELLDYQDELKDFDVPIKGGLFGWRPTELKITPFPWDVINAENAETAGPDIDEGE